jgi:hypothetical protein
MAESFQLDNAFLVDGHQKAVENYRSKINRSLNNEKLMALHWSVTEYVQLLHKCQNIIDRVERLKTLDWLCVKKDLEASFHDYHDYLTNLFRKKRQPATHVLVIMISDEERLTKPYATPVLYIPSQTLRDQHVRDLLTDVKKKLMEKGLVVVGE